MGNQDDKQGIRKLGTFVKGDPRINRTKPGPGKPPLWWKHALGRHEEAAVDLIGLAIEHGRRVLRQSLGKGGGKRGKRFSRSFQGFQRAHLGAAQDVLDRLHGKPTQPVEVVPPVDLSHLTRKELDDFNRLLARVLPGDGAGGTPRSR